jgi:hypothetical protein
MLTDPGRFLKRLRRRARTSGDPPSLAATPVAAAPQPSREALSAVFGRRTDGTRRDQAERFRDRLRDRGIVLTLDPSGFIRSRPSSGSVEPLSDAETAVLRWLRPELVACLGKRPQAPGNPASNVVEKETATGSHPVAVKIPRTWCDSHEEP